MIDMRSNIGTHNVLFITLDTLRYDVAQQAFMTGRTPFLASLLPMTGWEQRHSPGSFTYAAHHAFFAGFLPTPITPPPHPRLFAARFPHSVTIKDNTYAFDAPDIATALRQEGYRTLCFGGVQFFDKQSALGKVLPGFFEESYWQPETGIYHQESTVEQVQAAVTRLGQIPTSERVFLFMNVSAIHPPNYFYLPGATEDSLASHAAALAYVDRSLPPLFTAMQRRGPCILIMCADHGTTYGEDGYMGHRLGHPIVWTVPYLERILPQLG
jgi:hypothetical protein